MNTSLVPNEGKELVREALGHSYARFPVRTHVITANDRIEDVVERYAKPYFQPGDFLFMSERAVAITQGRSYPIKDIQPRPFATWLSKHVTKTPVGIGLGSPWTMELALREVGTPRILLAAAIAAVTKPLGIRGVFYHIAGRGAAAIDGPCSYTLPPYNECATLGPKDPNGVAKQLADRFHVEVVIIDANDLGVDILGRSRKTIPIPFAKAVFKDNPLGQSRQQTPLCIVRKQESREQ